MRLLNILLSLITLILSFIAILLALGSLDEKKQKWIDTFDANIMKMQCQENQDYSLVVTIYNLKSGVVTCEYQGKRYYDTNRNPKKAGPKAP